MVGNMLKLDKINTDEALRYMGYDGKISLDNIKALLDKCEQELIFAAVPRYIYKLFDITFEADGILINGSNIKLTGNSILKHLEGCNKIALLAATLSSNVDKLINKYQITDMTSALVADAMASAAIEQVCNIAEDELKQSIGNMYMTWRFSPGYGDLPIKLQAPLINILDAPKRIGLTVNSSDMMIPIKSVSAIIGISDKPIEQKRRGCAVCNMNKTCKFRKRGAHCGF